MAVVAVLAALLAAAEAMHSRKFAFTSRQLLNVPNSTSAVAASLAVPSSCVPDGAVVLSMSNAHHRVLRNLQFSLIQHEACFMQRVVSICWGEWEDHFGTCVRGSCDGGLGSACLPSDYRRSQYVALNWAKWPFFIDALIVARQLLWLEADVVIATNPWPLLLKQPAPMLQADVVYQWETPPCNLTSGTPPPSSLKPGAICSKTGLPHEEPLNCGQLLISSLPFARSVWASRPSKLYNGAPSQQHYANVVKHNFTHTGLPLEFFNHCWKAVSRTVRITDPCALVTYHATCGMNSKEKITLMQNFVVKAQKCPRTRSPARR
ncbi:hypothetical protein AB1Y20_012592 [Prymnesium parvum]|uniref:Nucleotide-diphospho-sugar transferase domain-containing protein n=1 Tax=Prymnesium parvum TaxID=97485 RepID=A0AB34IL24_PRYPA